MSKQNFTEIKNKFHSLSRSPLSEGQTNYDQMNARSGHIIYADDIRSESIPTIKTIEDRQYFLNEDNSIGNISGTQYINTIKFISNGKLQVISNTNNESYIIVDSEGNQIKNWISPEDKPISSSELSNGYEIKLFDVINGVKVEISRDCGWWFDPFNGILHFDEDFKYNSNRSKLSEFSQFYKIEGFIYIGKTESEKNEFVSTALDEINTELGDGIAIQPCKFSTDVMYKINDPFDSSIVINDAYLKMQTLSIVVKGYCFEVTSLNSQETISTKITHLSTGNSQIFIDVPWDPSIERPIIMNETSVDEFTYSFIATSFVTNDDKVIPIKKTIDYTKSEIEKLPVPNDLKSEVDETGQFIPDGNIDNTKLVITIG